jgi:GrpB-like predicted nucleotidyltransferase (UPF0157 family)
MTDAPADLVVEYDPTWPMVFDELRQWLDSVLVGMEAKVDHVGSTAVSGLVAKPIIDVDVVVPTSGHVPMVIERLRAAGYVHQGDLGVAGREAFRPPKDGPYHHLYVVVEGTEPHRDHVDLRDHLRRHPEDARRYAERKRELASLLGTDREAYTIGKGRLIEEMLARARAPARRPEEDP